MVLVHAEPYFGIILEMFIFLFNDKTFHYLKFAKFL